MMSASRRICGIILETLGVACLMVLVVLLLAEILIRMVNPDPKVQIIRRDRIRMFMHGEVPIWVQDHDRMNFQCPDRYPDARLIVFSGDSIFFGSGIRAEDSFTSLMQHTLDKEDGTGKWCILNLSQPGYSAEQKMYWLEMLLARHSPDAVYWEVWPNESNHYRVVGDAAYNFGRSDVAGEGPIPAAGSLRAWLMARSRLFEFVSVMTIGTSPFDLEWVYKSYVPMLKGLDSRLSAIGSVFSLVVATRLDKPFSQMTQVARDPQNVMLDVAKTEDLKMLFLHRLLLDAGADHLDIRYDPCCHFNEKGHLLLSRIFLAIIRTQFPDATADTTTNPADDG